jgi:SAM-dependent methyltransferase
MPPRDARSDWKAFEPEAIPSKTNLGPLEIVLADIKATFGQARPPLILDAGCGVGDVARLIYSSGFSVVGVDINESAILYAREVTAAWKVLSEGLSERYIDFVHEDILCLASSGLHAGAFSGVVCQLVMSIIGSGPDRVALLITLFAALCPGGYLYLSASGVSDDINPTYAQLYKSDLQITKEKHTYVSRDDQGKALYATHHFSEEELRQLLKAAGFCDIRIDKKRETSSRRGSQSAYFFYCYCRKPFDA